MLVKYKLILLLFICVISNSFAQPGFNRLYNFYPDADELNQLIVDNNIIISIGVAYDTVDWPSPLKIMMVRMDTFGNILDSRLLKDSLNDFLTMDFLWGDAIKTTQGNYAFPVFALNRRGELLIQIDSNLEVKSMFEFVAPDNQFGFDNAIVELHDGGFFISGTIQRPNFKADGFVRRIDKFGNLLWFKYYGNYFANDGFASMVKVNDNRFVLGGGYLERAKLWVIDSNGIVISEKVVPQPYPYLTSINGMLNSSTGDGFMAFGHTYIGDGPWGPKVQSSIMKFDDDLNLEWLHYVGPSSTQYNVFLDISPTPDGHYIVAGERTAYGDVTQPSNDWGGWLYKFSEQGDSLWSRADNAPLPYDATGEFVYGGVGVLSSGSIVAGGRGDVDNQFVGFVVKVSADGCMDTIFCQTSPVQEPSIRTVDEVLVYPNPASELVAFSFDGTHPGDKRLTLWNVYGQILKDILISSIQDSYSFSISEFGNGVYFWKINNDAGHSVEGRLSIQH